MAKQEAALCLINRCQQEATGIDLGNDNPALVTLKTLQSPAGVIFPRFCSAAECDVGEVTAWPWVTQPVRNSSLGKLVLPPHQPMNSTDTSLPQLHWLLQQFSWKSPSTCEGWEAFPLEIRLVPDEPTILLFSLRYHILSTHNIGNCISNSCIFTNCKLQFRPHWFCCVHDPSYWACAGVGKAPFVTSELQWLFMHRGDIADKDYQSDQPPVLNSLILPVFKQPKRNTLVWEFALKKSKPI